VGESEVVMTKDYYFVAKCGCGFGTLLVGGPDDDSDESCLDCTMGIEYIEIHKVPDPDKVIVAAEAELEDANFHSIGSLPSILYSAIAPLVADDQKLALAWKIANAMPS
jgi:hypothetical protein